MDSFKDLIRKSLAQKSMGKRMIGSIGLKTIQDFFQNPNLEGFIRFDTLYIKTSDQAIKIKAFHQKKQILEKVNQELQNLGYSKKVNDIRF